MLRSSSPPSWSAQRPRRFLSDGNRRRPAGARRNPPANDSNDIDEQQMFLFRAKGPVDAKTFVAHVFCEVEGVRSVDNVRPSAVPGAPRCCGRRDQQHRKLDCVPLHANFPSGANVTIRWDSPTANTKRRAVETLRFKVRSGDWLEVNCSRETRTPAATAVNGPRRLPAGD